MSKGKTGILHSIRVEGVDLPLKFEHVPLDEVRLDADNPRTRELCRRLNGAATPQALRKMLLEVSGVGELQRAIREAGGIHDPIFIRDDGRVVEGNCRTAIYHRLREARKGDPNWQAIPAYRLPPHATERQVAVLQGSWHVARKNSWRAQEQAGHVHHMKTDLGMTIAEISAALGAPERVIERQIASFETMRDHVLPALGHADGMKKYSYVEELFKNRKLESFRKDAKNVKFVAKLIVEGKVSKGAHVRDLHKILDTPRAKDVLSKEGVVSALREVGKKDPTADSKVFRKLKAATETLQEMRQPELQRLKTGAKEQQILVALYRALDKVAKHTGVQLK